MTRRDEILKQHFMNRNVNEMIYNICNDHDQSKKYMKERQKFEEKSQQDFQGQKAQFPGRSA